MTLLEKRKDKMWRIRGGEFVEGDTRIRAGSFILPTGEDNRPYMPLSVLTLANRAVVRPPSFTLRRTCFRLNQRIWVASQDHIAGAAVDR
jgi:hypothetical protein